ncbi:MAG: cation transporting ATPase C-terminal domain-containing protein, partial [Phycisphaerae bacterium]|nr:cation transporting ATPase C-terminal domain-containing protein [Saprospiraceae bacterium]
HLLCGRRGDHGAADRLSRPEVRAAAHAPVAENRGHHRAELLQRVLADAVEELLPRHMLVDFLGLLAISAALLLAILYVPFLTSLFRMSPISAIDLGCCVLAGFLSVAWFEVWKMLRDK